jgi:RNA polymerase sigma-70 factor (ECF subfamily)
VRGDIGKYGGRGALRAWIRTLATRAGLRFVERSRPAPEADEAVLAALPTTGDPELDAIRDLYAPAFRAAFQEALATLKPRSRTLLAQHYVDGLTIDELGALHSVHRATAARQIAQVRDSLVEATLWTLKQRLRVTARDLESIVRIRHTQLVHELRTALTT